MQFQVPQFIEVEDKIFGPFTFRQFIWIIGGVGSVYLLMRFLPIYIGGPIGIITAALAIALAFGNINGRPFIQGLESALYYYVRPRLYLWNNTRTKTDPVTSVAALQDPTHSNMNYIPTLSASKLHDLAWSLDIKERIASGTGNDLDRRMAGGVFTLRTSQESLHSR